jgi:HAD superfamily hydrolase (TIGR01509 family)
MIKAVIFDCFGVLANDGWLPFRNKYFGNDQQKLSEATDLNKQSNAGFIGYDDFLSQVADLADIPAAQARNEIENNPADISLFTYIREKLKPRYKIGMMSNASDYHLDDIFTVEQVALFDEIVLSYQVGAVKPDPIMYQTIANRLGVLVEECIFIDDQQRYVEGANALGMKGVQFVDTATTIAKIEEVLHA